MRDHLLLSHPNPYEWVEGPLQLWRRSHAHADSHTYCNADSDSDSDSYSDSYSHADGHANSDAYTYGYCYGHTDWLADLHAGCVAAGGEHAYRPVWGGRRFQRHVLLCCRGLLLQLGYDPRSCESV